MQCDLQLLWILLVHAALTNLSVMLTSFLDKEVESLTALTLDLRLELLQVLVLCHRYIHGNVWMVENLVKK